MSVSRIPKNTVVKIDGEGTGVLNLQNLKLMKPFMTLKSKGSIFVCLFNLNIGLKLYRRKSRQWQVHLYVSNQLGSLI